MEVQVFGKTTFISILAKLIQRKKVLIIDFNLINNNLHSVFGVKQISNEMKEKLKEENFLNEFRLKESNLKQLIVRVNRKIDLISKTNIVFDDNYILKEDRIRKMLEEIGSIYELVLIDTSSDTKYKNLTKALTNLSDKIICITQGNIVNLRKTMNLLKEYEENRSRIRLIYNQKSKYTLSAKLLKIIFLKFKIIGYLEYDNRYNKIINKSVKSLYISKKIKNEFQKIIKKI